MNKLNSSDINGLLLIDKPAKWTSHDVVAKLRNHFNLKKVGHAGTLDPMATGLLILLIGKMTKLSSFIMNEDKIYDGSILLGKKTNTQDIEGEITKIGNPNNVTQEIIEKMIKPFNGKIMQIPPMVSAIKKDGVPLYKLARKGIEINRVPREVNIKKFIIHSYDNYEVKFTVECSKGTYIRTLANDLGDNIGCYACLSSLRRIASGKFNIINSYSLDDVLKLDKNDFKNTLINYEKN